MLKSLGVFLKICLFKMQSYSKREKNEEREIFHLLIQSPDGYNFNGPAHAEAMSLEFHPGRLRG